jgi:Ser/Thr protein kinase RdoA (MazF antagonist)
VWSVRDNGQLAVARLGRRSDRRSDADLLWEMELLRYLDREGMAVPVPIPTMDGRDFVDGLVVMTYVEGRPPETEADLRRVADTFRQLHGLMQGWAPTSGLAIVDRLPARGERDEGRPSRDAAGWCRSMPGDLGAA